MYPTDLQKLDGAILKLAGSRPSHQELRMMLEFLDRNDYKNIVSVIQSFTGNWSLQVYTNKSILLAVDHVSSYPLFYDERSLKVSEYVYAMDSELDINTPQYSEFLATGYVLGRNTLQSHLKRVEAGQVLVIDKASKKTLFFDHFVWDPFAKAKFPVKGDLTTTQSLFENVFDELAWRVSDREILIPLSGGLDSRLILTALHERGCKNLRPFTYGPAMNAESKVARQFCERLNIPWLFVDVPNSFIINFGRSCIRNEFMHKNWNWSAVPNVQDLHIFAYLKDRNMFSNECVVINGQAGDFITGGHVLLPKNEPCLGWFKSAVVDKHFRLITNEQTRRFEADYFSNTGYRTYYERALRSEDPEDWVTLAQIFEWRERQSKYVVAGQRVYDWFGIDWELPLFDVDLMRYFVSKPPDQLANQALYRHYISQSYERKGLVKNQAAADRWPGALGSAIKCVARVVGLLGSGRHKKFVYQFCRYFGYYKPYYLAHGYSLYLKTWKYIRSPVALEVLRLLGYKNG